MRKLILIATGLFFIANPLVTIRALPPPDLDDLFNKCDVAVTAKLVDIRIDPVSTPYRFNVSLHYYAEHFWKGNDKQEFIRQLNVVTPGGEEEIRSYHILEMSYLIFYDNSQDINPESKTSCPGWITQMSDQFHQILLARPKNNKGL
jgi:hypothetical protein